MSTNAKSQANAELELRLLEDHELEIVRGGVLGLIPRPSLSAAPTEPSRNFTPTDPC